MTAPDLGPNAIEELEVLAKCAGDSAIDGWVFLRACNPEKILALLALARAALVKDAEIAGLKNVIDQLDAQVKVEGGGYKALADEIAALKQEYASLSESHAELSARVVTLTAKIERLVAAGSGLNALVLLSHYGHASDFNCADSPCPMGRALETWTDAKESAS